MHLRYPQDLFAIQATQYQTFHMTDPQVFYNREDLWVPPQETYDGRTGPMEPYYILMKLPGSDQLEYMLMSPFTPQNRDNMISWLAARSDFPNYGKILFYQLPKDKLTYGPNQIAAMINQSTTISEQLTLWDQKGSGDGPIHFASHDNATTTSFVGSSSSFRSRIHFSTLFRCTSGPRARNFLNSSGSSWRRQTRS
jgi:uncharacterized membrane protein (UPF0182 family)